MNSLMMTIVWWLNFVLATVSLSRVFGLCRQWTAGDVAAVPALLMWGLVLISTMTFLAFEGYLKAKRENKLVRTFSPFEWVIARLMNPLKQEQGGLIRP